MSSLIRTPHAAIKIWNYIDRISAHGADKHQANLIKEEIVSTVSCQAIQTFKSKGDPVGRFNFVLAPTRNWISVITPGSWCVIMMSNEPLNENSFKKADPKLVKMFGRIDSIRAEVSTDSDGTRKTVYLVSGEDWGCMFNTILYIDPIVAAAKDTKDSQGNVLFSVVEKYLLQNGNVPQKYTVYDNLQMLLSILGKPLLEDVKVDRLAKATYSIAMPEQASRFFNFVDRSGKITYEQKLNKSIKLVVGKLVATGKYVHVNDGIGWVNPFALVGQNSFWQVLMDNCNHALNEMFTEIRWLKNGPQLTVFSRIKPFSYGPTLTKSSLRSKFTLLPVHKLESSSVISINAGTSWKEKYNFVEIKLEFSELHLYGDVTKNKCQASSSVNVYNREGFRPLIFNIRQAPGSSVGDLKKLDPTQLQPWANLIKEWHFDTHRLLNGQLTMTGSSEYIEVGNNILFDAGLINATPNFNSASKDKSSNNFILAHVESVTHNFDVASDGARQFRTTVQFVRGILVDKELKLIGEGALDKDSRKLTKDDSKNTASVIASAAAENPFNENS